MRVVLSGGGTGGHIYPALALRKQLLNHRPETDFLYIGTHKGLEERIVQREGISFRAIEIQGIKRSLSLDNVKTVYLMLRSIQKAKQYLKEYQPDVVIGTGGYVCAPVLYAAAKLHIPTIIHEQNSVAGVTNKFLARYVDKIAICFKNVEKDFQRYQNKLVFTGNPRAQEVARIQTKADLGQWGLDSNTKTVLFFGGSRGAQKINETLIEALPFLSEAKFQSLIVTGDIYYEWFQDKCEEFNASSKIKIVSYIDNMPEILNAVDLVVCRSGATTLTELTALAKSSILIPSPNVTGNHQQYNAQSLVESGAAEMILEKNLTATHLFGSIEEIMNDDAKRATMSNHADQIGIKDAGERLIKVIDALVD